MLLKKVLTCLALALFLALPFGASGCNTVISGSGEIATWEMAYSDFNRLEVSSAFEVAIERADSYAVTITIDKKLYEYLRIDQRGDTLRIGLKPGYSYIETEQRAVVNLTDLRSLKLSDASRAVVTGFTVSYSLDFELTDASRLELGHTITGDCKFTLSDASEVNGIIEMNDGDFRLGDASSFELKGSANNIKIDASSSSEADLAEFAVVTADVKLSSASHAVVNASTRMDVELSAASLLEYIDYPKLKLGKFEVSGGSTIEKR